MNIEERVRLFRYKLFNVNTDWEIAPFLDLGAVEPARREDKELRVNPGVGFRAVVRPNVVGRVDIGFGKEGPAVGFSLYGTSADAQVSRRPQLRAWFCKFHCRAARRGCDQESVQLGHRHAAIGPRYLFVAVSSTVRSLRARAWHERNEPFSFSSSRRTAAEQRPCSTLPEITRILQVPQPPPRQPKTTFAPDLRMALNTVSSPRHTTVSPIGLNVIVYNPASGRLHSSGPRYDLCINTQERLVQLL